MNRAERRLRRRNRNRRIKKLMITAVVVVIIMGLGIGWTDVKESTSLTDLVNRISAGAAGLFHTQTPGAGESPGLKVYGAEDTESAAQNNTFAFSQPTTQVNINDLQDTRYLELINTDNPVTSWPEAGLLRQVWPAAPVGVSQDTLLNEAALSAVIRLFDEARDNNIGTLYVGSGYRDYEEQNRLYEEAWDKSYVQPPNHSEHHTGLAADIYALGVNTYEMASSKEGRWLADNAWRCGLILRYAEGKSDITQIAYEPWHFRYVGQPHARYMFQNNMCLEEYIRFLADSGGYRTEYDGKSYTILYARPENGLISIPEGLECTVSGDNTGGYVITARE